MRKCHLARDDAMPSKVVRVFMDPQLAQFVLEDFSLGMVWGKESDPFWSRRSYIEQDKICGHRNLFGMVMGGPLALYRLK